MHDEREIEKERLKGTLDALEFTGNLMINIFGCEYVLMAVPRKIDQQTNKLLPLNESGEVESVIISSLTPDQMEEFLQSLLKEDGTINRERFKQVPAVESEEIAESMTGGKELKYDA